MAVLNRRLYFLSRPVKVNVQVLFFSNHVPLIIYTISVCLSDYIAVIWAVVIIKYI